MKKRFILVFFVLILSFSSLCATSEEARELTLQKSIQIAMESSPAIKSAKEAMVAADGRLGQAFGAVLPNVSLSGAAGQSYSDPSSMTFQEGTTEMSVVIGTTEKADMSNYTFSLTQPLFAGGRLLSALEIAQAGYGVAKEGFRKAQYDLSYNVVNSYYGALRAKKMYELSQESLDMAKSHLDQVNAMYAAGTATKADVLRSEVQVAAMELQLKRSANALALAKDAFNNVLGQDLDSPVLLSEREIAKEVVKAKTYQECSAIVFGTSPDWQIYQLNKKIGEKTVGVESANYWPTIALTGKTGNSRTNYPTYPGDTNVNAWSVMATGSWTLFDGFSTASRIKEAQANLDSLRTNEEATRNGIFLQVKDACLNLQSAIDVITSAKKAVESAQENYNISKEKYRSGIGSNLEMIDAQTALAQAKTDLYQTQFDYQVAKAKVNQVLGSDIYSF